MICSKRAVTLSLAHTSFEQRWKDHAKSKTLHGVLESWRKIKQSMHTSEEWSYIESRGAALVLNQLVCAWPSANSSPCACGCVAGPWTSTIPPGWTELKQQGFDWSLYPVTLPSYAVLSFFIFTSPTLVLQPTAEVTHHDLIKLRARRSLIRNEKDTPKTRFGNVVAAHGLTPLINEKTTPRARLC